MKQRLSRNFSTKPAEHRRRRAWPRLGARLLGATTRIMLRLALRIERVFGLPPEAVGKALKRITRRSGPGL